MGSCLNHDASAKALWLMIALDTQKDGVVRVVGSVKLMTLATAGFERYRKTTRCPSNVSVPFRSRPASGSGDSHRSRGGTAVPQWLQDHPGDCLRHAVGIGRPRGRVPPLAFGISTSRTGGGWHEPDDSRFQ